MSEVFSTPEFEAAYTYNGHDLGDYVLQMAQNDFKSIRFHFTSEF